MWRGPVVALLLLVCCVRLLEAASVETRRNAREPASSAFATEVKDLLGEGNSPGKQQKTAKKDTRNMSGKSDEGGYYKTYGSDAEGEKGYLTATYSKGNHGYKTLDTFHKQDGDKYAFEKHVAYGKARADKKSSHNDEARSRSGKAGDHEGEGTEKLYNVEHTPSSIPIMQATRVMTGANTMVKPTGAILTRMSLTIRIMGQNLRITSTVKATQMESMVLTEATAPIREALATNITTTTPITIKSFAPRG
ncbi:hypothetical protein K0M31_003026 [Melipona bicolor]|uniref:Trematode Eggshell Synthesis n=1 Tax=Melipona bicolor TaxID=60889 RepID=A0AA40G0D2_9HYME|nr:hypothetical protein K0M31_003026 [Melipona bicolor]